MATEELISFRLSLRTVGHFNIEENPWGLNLFFFHGCLSFRFTSVHPLKPPLCDRRGKERGREGGRITNQSTSGSDPYNPPYIDIAQDCNSGKSLTLSGGIDQEKIRLIKCWNADVPLYAFLMFFS